MTWTTETSPREDIALERAGDALNKALDRRVRLSVQMRVTACMRDTLSFVTLLRNLEAGEASRSDALDAQIEEWRKSDKRTAPAGKWDSQRSFEFAAAVKATYYFVRALQDSVYAALLESTGQRAGAYTSMQKCAENPANPIRQLIGQALPGYFDWFSDLRGIRNQMKLGVSTAFGFRGVPGEKQVRVILQDIDDSNRHVSQGREISLVDVETSLVQSARLLRWAAEHISSGATGS
jgi:hypothetical protein